MACAQRAKSPPDLLICQALAGGFRASLLPLTAVRELTIWPPVLRVCRLSIFAVAENSDGSRRCLAASRWAPLDLQKIRRVSNRAMIVRGIYFVSLLQQLFCSLDGTAVLIRSLRSPMQVCDTPGRTVPYFKVSILSPAGRWTLPAAFYTRET
jgi:hypothetical protein